MASNQKVSVITGASREIRAAFVKAYQDRSYRVVTTARSEAPYGYGQAVQRGNMIYIWGQLSRDEESRVVGRVPIDAAEGIFSLGTSPWEVAMWDRTALGTVSVLLNRLLGGRPGESLCFAAASRLGTDCLLCRLVGWVLRDPGHCEDELRTRSTRLSVDHESGTADANGLRQCGLAFRTVSRNAR
ncbi:hypothetical protein [Mesorhizobium sp.]|uniref:hypothetical protein n=1 Tax=Mesorhizobium sp. TaxID=1871066 RepID=UPI001213A91B|nr:hypothetical protein [Mesorhizobium sp.]TIL30441.1 MAG: hypothetical protein E5Y85_24305 [Mesorhizobium sp.]TIL51133.1 MAG: hypothetical protein E5Y83_19625 [Mesorhizobium sp.]